jgi:hypothetical protein
MDSPISGVEVFDIRLNNLSKLRNEYNFISSSELNLESETDINPINVFVLIHIPAGRRTICIIQLEVDTKGVF